MAESDANPTQIPATSSEPIKRSGRNLSIEGLRGLAALLVLISHINGIAVEKDFAPPWQNYLDQRILTHLGTFGVCAFFCISGYLIIQSLAKHSDLKVFAINRAKRIYPLFIALQLVAFPAALILKSDLTPFKKEPIALAGHFISNLFFVPGVFDLPIAQKNAWSLSFEAVFYVSAALLFIGFRKPEKDRLPSRVWPLIGLLIAVAMLLFRPYAWFFLLGALVFLQRDKAERFTRFIGGPFGLAALVGMYLVLPEGWRFVPAINPYEMEAGPSWAYTLATIPKWLLTLPLAAVFFASVAYEKGWLASFLRQRWLVWLGTISYSLYLVHPFILHPLGMVEKKFGSAGPYAFIVLGLGLSVAIAAATYYGIEVWLTNQIFRKRTPKAMGSDATTGQPNPGDVTASMAAESNPSATPPQPPSDVPTSNVSPNLPPNDEDIILLRPYLVHLWTNKWRVLMWSAGLTLLALAIAFLNPAVYRCSAVIVTPSASTVSVGQALAGTASPLSILHGIGDSAATYMEVSKAAKMPTQDVRDALDFEEEGVFSQLAVVATHRSKAKAELMVKTALDHMRETSSGLSFTMAEQQMTQLESALAKKEQEVLAAQSQFSEFQKSLKTAPDPANPLATTQYLARLQQIESQLGLVRKKLEVARKLAAKPEIKNPDLPSGIPDRDRFRNQIVQLEYQLQVAKIKGGPKNPAVIALERELQLAKQNFQEQVRNYLKSIDSDTDETIANLTGEELGLQWQYEYNKALREAAPEEALEYSRQQDKVNALEAARDGIRKQLEDAKLSSQVYKFVWTVLQQPFVETTPVNKKYGLIALLGFFASLVIVVATFCIRLGTKGRKDW